MPEAFDIRLLTASDLESAMALKEAAGWNQTEQDWSVLLELAPQSCFAVEHAGVVVASATAMVYGRELAWIGMVLALPEFRGRGFGRAAFLAALDHCRRNSISSIKLDATPAGEPLYARAGFQPEYVVERWGFTGAGAAPGSFATKSLDLPDLNDARLASLIPADTEAFGVRRDGLLCALRRQASWAACTEGNGRLTAYAMGRRGTNSRYFGPCVAERVEDAAQLLDGFLDRHPREPVFVDVPAPNEAARQMLRERGFEVRRTLLRMYLGQNDRPGHPARIFALAGFEYG